MEEQKGQGTLEYALILTLVAIIAIAVLVYLGSRMESVFYSVTEVLLSNCESAPESVRDYSESPHKGTSTGTGEFTWPTDKGRITQKAWHCHHAIDIADSEGTPIYAADSGYVVVIANWKGGYGKAVVIDHNTGFQTLYAHLSSISGDISVGCWVEKGQQIGEMGNTGHSTGTHLHFEIREGSHLHDPLEFVSPP